MPVYPKEPHAYQPQFADGTPMPFVVLAPSQAVASQVVRWRKLSVREALAAVEGGAQTIYHIPPTEDGGTTVGEEEFTLNAYPEVQAAPEVQKIQSTPPDYSIPSGSGIGIGVCTEAP